MIRGISRNLKAMGAVVALGALLLAGMLATGTAQATEGGPLQCQDPDLVVTASDTNGAGGIAIGVTGEVIAVCVATDDDHSALVEEDGTILDGCVTVSGIGGSQVSISRDADCGGITHVDLFFQPSTEVQLTGDNDPGTPPVDETPPAMDDGGTIVI